MGADRTERGEIVMGSILKYGCGGAVMLIVIGIGAVMLVAGLAAQPGSKTSQAVATIQAAPPMPVCPKPTLASYEGVTESQLRAELEKGNKGGTMSDPVPFREVHGFLVDHQTYFVSVTVAEDVSGDPSQKPAAISAVV